MSRTHRVFVIKSMGVYDEYWFKRFFDRPSVKVLTNWKFLTEERWGHPPLVRLDPWFLDLVGYFTTGVCVRDMSVSTTPVGSFYFGTHGFSPSGEPLRVFICHCWFSFLHDFRVSYPKLPSYPQAILPTLYHCYKVSLPRLTLSFSVPPHTTHLVHRGRLMARPTPLPSPLMTVEVSLSGISRTISPC